MNLHKVDITSTSKLVTNNFKGFDFYYGCYADIYYDDDELYDIFL